MNTFELHCNRNTGHIGYYFHTPGSPMGIAGAGFCGRNEEEAAQMIQKHVVDGRLSDDVYIYTAGGPLIGDAISPGELEEVVRHVHEALPHKREQIKMGRPGIRA